MLGVGLDGVFVYCYGSFWLELFSLRSPFFVQSSLTSCWTIIGRRNEWLFFSFYINKLALALSIQIEVVLECLFTTINVNYSHYSHQNNAIRVGKPSWSHHECSQKFRILRFIHSTRFKPAGLCQSEPTQLARHSHRTAGHRDCARLDRDISGEHNTTCHMVCTFFPGCSIRMYAFCADRFCWRRRKKDLASKDFASSCKISSIINSHLPKWTAAGSDVSITMSTA